MIGRVRLINPAFFMDEDLARLDPHARLLFIGLWTIADKNGRLEDIPGRIKACLFPYEADLGLPKLLDQLCAPKQSVNGALLERYEVDGRKFIQIISFSKYQKPHPREADSGFPSPQKAQGEPRPALGAPRREVVVVDSVSKSESDSGFGSGKRETISEASERLAIPTAPTNGLPIDEIQCPICLVAGFLKRSQPTKTFPGGWWCRPSGGCGENFPLNFPAIWDRLPQRVRETLKDAVPEMKTKAQTTEDAVMEGMRRVQERGVILREGVK